MTAQSTHECRCTMPVTFIGRRCLAVFNLYAADDSVAVSLVEEETGFPVCTASVCLADRWHVADGEVLIKEYRENGGVLASLVTAGVVEAPHEHLDVAMGVDRVPSGDDAECYVAVCRLTAAALEAGSQMLAACELA